jgi:hypothetical protein
MADVSKLEDPFNLVAGVVGLTIVKGMEKSGRGITVYSNSLILYFNFVFFASIPPMESYRLSPVSL